MTRRMIDSSMWTNEHFGEMPMMARLLLLGIINHADDQGRVKAHLVFLRSQIFPYDDIDTEQIADSLRLIEANGTIAWYEVDGKHYVQLLNWWEYQSLNFAMPSDYPPPPDWHDRIRFNGKGGIFLTHNWHKVDGTVTLDTCNERGEPIPKLPVEEAKTHVDGHVDTQVDGHVDAHLSRQDQEQDQEQLEDQEKEKAAEAAAAAAGPLPAWLRALWLKNMSGAITPLMEGLLKRASLEFRRDEIEEAIKICNGRGHSDFAYMEGVLRKGAFAQAPPQGEGMRKSYRAMPPPERRRYSVNPDELYSSTPAAPVAELEPTP